MLEADKNLVDLSIAGDEAAQSEIYRQYYSYVYHACLRIMRDAGDAEEIAQRAFIQFFKKATQYRGDARLSTFLFAIARNECYQEFRKRKADKTDSIESANSGDLPDPFDFTVADKIDLERAVRKLPHGYRQVFVLRDINGYDQNETAKILNVSIGTVKSQLFMARQNLQKLIMRRANPRIYERAI